MAITVNLPLTGTRRRTRRRSENRRGLPLSAKIAAAVILLIVLAAIFAPLLTSAEPTKGLLTDRLNKFPLVLTFLATYFGFFTLASVANPHGVAEMFREPFLQAALFLAFFMLTDPPTSPNRYGDQVWYGLLAALAAGAAQLLGAGQVFLLLGVLASNGVLAIVRYARRRDTANLVSATVPS